MTATMKVVKGKIGFLVLVAFLALGKIASQPVLIIDNQCPVHKIAVELKMAINPVNFLKVEIECLTMVKIPVEEFTWYYIESDCSKKCCFQKNKEPKTTSWRLVWEGHRYKWFAYNHLYLTNYGCEISP